MMDKLTAKQERFISEYLKDFNSTRAARDAGYSENTASEMGYENLRKPQIKKAISKYIDSILHEDQLSLKTRILKELKKLAFETTEGKDKVKSLELLGKYLALWTDKVEQTNKNPVEVTITPVKLK